MQSEGKGNRRLSPIAASIILITLAVGAGLVGAGLIGLIATKGNNITKDVPSPYRVVHLPVNIILPGPPSSFNITIPLAQEISNHTGLYANACVTNSFVSYKSGLVPVGSTFTVAYYTNEQMNMSVTYYSKIEDSVYEQVYSKNFVVIAP